ncbi:SDR family NAD(P)-dependent oxidoreductase [Actinomadura barringtoniae]|uniref:SDR family NAD(P)-dependent oxidoreductase n=1 Tax=Actinomadura barringtoniae TaxID=1427535 RepID=A0A939PBQ7_9ACTN|nr:SDR family NAD(P)-dependent oxidoreductase [Actinomadura barringtoniae]MBO2449711.1 SDR family NAD(P)-dependent oxidoreductase [Actinomadura barringtoniae]
MGKVAIVTGGNQGLGLALVRGLCRELGENGVVYLAARDRGRGEQAVRELEGEGSSPRLELLNVRDDASVRQCADRLAERHGGVDIVISNAAARISPGVPNADQVRDFVDTNNHGTRRMIEAFGPRLRDGARFVVVASSFGTLASLDPRLHQRFNTEHMTQADVAKVMDAYVDAVEAGRATDEGWPDWINPPSKVGQVAAVRVMARDMAEEAAWRDIIINAACPGLVDTAASRPWFDDMTEALSPDQAAVDVLWLATLPVGTRRPYGELVQYRTVLPFIQEPTG